MTIQIVLTSIGISLSLTAGAQTSTTKMGPVQVRYATDIASRFMVKKDKFTDTTQNLSIPEIIRQVGADTFHDIVNGIAEEDKPCELAVLCNGLTDPDSLNARYGRLSLERIATFDGYDGKSKDKLSIVRLGNVPANYGTKPLFIMMETKYLVPVEKWTLPMITPKLNLRPVTIRNWQGLQLQVPDADHMYWFGRDGVNEEKRSMVISRQVGSGEYSRMSAQIGRMERKKTYLPEEIRNLSFQDPGIEKQLAGVKLYYIASYNHAVVNGDTVKYAILKMPYTENAVFFKTKDWNLDVYFFVDEKYIKVGTALHNSKLASSRR